MDYNPKELERMMSEAAALPPHDPHRIEVARAVVEAGDQAEARWLELVDEDERLRLELLHVEPPAGLADRLLALPDEHADETRPGILYSLRRWATAAAAAIVLGVGLLVLVVGEGPGLDGQLQALGAEAIRHVSHHKPAGHVRFAGTSAADLQPALNKKVHFDVRIPKMGDGFDLLGADICKMAHKDVVCTHWKHQGQQYTLIQFCPVDHDLPTDFQKRMVGDTGPWRASGSPQAVFWTEDGCVYALVTTPGHTLKHGEQTL